MHEVSSVAPRQRGGDADGAWWGTRTTPCHLLRLPRRALRVSTTPSRDEACGCSPAGVAESRQAENRRGGGGRSASFWVESVVAGLGIGVVLSTRRRGAGSGLFGGPPGAPGLEARSRSNPQNGRRCASGARRRSRYGAAGLE